MRKTTAIDVSLEITSRMPVEDTRILREGETCWQVSRADRLSIIVDAADFFHAAKRAMLKARHSILLIG